MGQRGSCQGLDVVGRDVLLAADARQGLGAAIQAQGGAGACAQLNVGMLAGGADHLDQIAAEDGIDVYLANQPLDAEDVVRRRHGPKGTQRIGVLESLQHGGLVVFRGVAEAEAQQEAVDLRLGQREGALEFDGVLRGQHQEGRGQWHGILIDGDLPLGHGFQQRRLGPGCGAVDLVSQDNLGNHRAGAELELPVVLVVVMDAGDVRGHQIGSELDAAELAVQGVGQRTR